MADVVQHADMGMIQRCYGASFALEAIAVRGENLESDGALEPGIARLVHLAHTARPRWGHDLVVPELVTPRERHAVKFSRV